MSFHEYSDSDMDILIPLPTWVLDAGRENPEIFFTDQQGRRNRQCLTWGVDRERVLKGRNALEVFYNGFPNLVLIISFCPREIYGVFYVKFIN